MRKILFIFLIGLSSLFGDVISVLPYGGRIDYGNDEKASTKDYAILYGVHASIGNLEYLLEVDYSQYTATYKDRTLPQLVQDDITIVYGKYFPTWMYRFGVHYINTNDVQLGDGIVGILGIEGYKFYGYDKLSYGVNGYISYYKDGHSEIQNADTDPTRTIIVTQMTPHIGYYIALNENLGNQIDLELNTQFISKYHQKSYFSYEISDTVYYKNVFFNLKYYDGEMRSGIKDNGFTVFNTLDMLKYGYGAKIGVNLQNLTVALNYISNTYREYDPDGIITKDNTNSLYFMTLSLGF